MHVNDAVTDECDAIHEILLMEKVQHIVLKLLLMHLHAPHLSRHHFSTISGKFYHF